MVPLRCPEYLRWSLQQGKYKVTFILRLDIDAMIWGSSSERYQRRLGKPGQLPATSWQYDKHSLYLHLFCLRVVEETPHVR